MTADVEDEYVVAQANEPLDEERHVCTARRSTPATATRFLEMDRDKVDYMDVSPKMVVSVATAMIPFLENDDANRALMGSNMQRQAVPLLKTESPDRRHRYGIQSGGRFRRVRCLRSTTAWWSSVSADEVTDQERRRRALTLMILLSSCAPTRAPASISVPIVDKGETGEGGRGDCRRPGHLQRRNQPWQKRADRLYDLGRLQLRGRRSASMKKSSATMCIPPSILRNMKLKRAIPSLGPEEITRDIPNVGEDALKDLDERGIIRVGAEVRAGDILVGKVTPKGETELTAEERLLRAIFGEKAREVRDTSLTRAARRIRHRRRREGVYPREQLRRACARASTRSSAAILPRRRKISVGDKMAGRHGNKGVVSRILPQEDMPFLPDGTPLDIVLNPLGVPSRMNIGQVLEVHLGLCRKGAWLEGDDAGIRRRARRRYPRLP